MNFLLLVPSFLLTLLLVVHAVRVRGGRTALAFFVPAFLFGVIRGNSVAVLAPGENSGPYIFNDAVLSIGRAELPACVGWVFALYLSWCLAEGITSRNRALAGRVFPLAAFGILAMGGFSYAVETAASGVGWWRWNLVRRATPFLTGGTHLFGIVEWMSVGFDFLVPFLLFRTDRGLRSGLAWASLSLYPIHWITHWKQVTAPGLPHAYEIFHAVIAFSVAVFPILVRIRLADPPAREAPRLVRAIPAGATLAMFAVLAVADVGVLGEPELLISMLPLGVLLAAATGPRGAFLLTASAGALFASAGTLMAGRGIPVALARAVPVLLPAACVLIFGDRAGLSARRARRRAYLAAVGVAVLLTAAGLVLGKREREEYSRLMDRSRTLLRSGDTAGAERSLKEAIALKPNVNLAPKDLANLYGGLGRFDDAWREAAVSLDLDPSDWEAHRLAANVLRALGKSGEAVRYYERALMLHSSDVESAKGLAECHFRAGRADEAIAVLRRSLDRSPGDPDLAPLLGATLIQTKDYRGAYRVVSDFLRRAPDDPSAHLLMAYIHLGTGNTAAARAECEKVLSLKPDDPQARQILESLSR